MEKKILAFLNSNRLGVISTNSSDRKSPESALVGFSNNEQLELVFGTSNKTRKYNNISHNPNVSFVVGWDPSLGTLQYEGVASELSKEQEATLVPLLIERNGGSLKFVNLDDQRYFLVRPSWIRFLDNAGDPPGTHELTFD